MEAIEQKHADQTADEQLDQSGEPITVSHPLCDAIYMSNLGISQEVAEKLAERLVRLGHWRPDQPEPSAAGGVELPLYGEWRHGGGYLCCGTLRIARESFDTTPVEGFKAEVFDWVCETLNARRNWHPAPASELAELRAEVERLRECESHLKACTESLGEVPLFNQCNGPLQVHGNIKTLLAMDASASRRIESLEEQLATLTARAETAERERDAWKHSYDAVLSQARKDNLRAEDADRYEQWLLDIGKLSGCGHVDDNLTRCIEQHVHGLERERDALREALAWCKREAHAQTTHPIHARDDHACGWCEVYRTAKAALATQGTANAD